MRGQGRWSCLSNGVYTTVVNGVELYVCMMNHTQRERNTRAKKRENREKERERESERGVEKHR